MKQSFDLCVPDELTGHKEVAMQLKISVTFSIQWSRQCDSVYASVTQ